MTRNVVQEELKKKEKKIKNRGAVNHKLISKRFEVILASPTLHLNRKGSKIVLHI